MRDRQPDPITSPGRPASPEARLPGSPAEPPEDHRQVEALLRGDEHVYADLVQRHHASLLRVASLYVRDRAVAEEVVQDAWIGVLEGLEGFQGRASLKTWIFRILINTAKKRAVREGRSIPFSALEPSESAGFEPSVGPERFLDSTHRWAGHWQTPPQSWAEIPEDRLLSKETLDRVERAIEALPPQQRAVIALRDIDGWSALEVCNILDLTDTNQRVLLHRARSQVRLDLERYLQDIES